MAGEGRERRLKSIGVEHEAKTETRASYTAFGDWFPTAKLMK